ncbi:LysR family transcriptional regulator [Nitratireductor aquimarinus]|uniref:LysR family transcriptional regulator n=1 Tax=Alphaproteobacteria TaxID=28211 RepID=UPI0019D402F5|nr:MULTISPECIES: LysR family transcriptional regulator [Alphaproteobacteria]MBN7758100.1 LysR family transcriptional regulator [Nitratireductor aquimarinus]MBY6000861.1 LysR family transcriptional regulator [Tritonibacter mobilis]MBY6022893.1 LysR family transcriptional regulator [Nitratireductor sp. DP7N14-4]
MSGNPIEPSILRRMRNVSLRQLIYFDELARLSGFNRAAKSLAISQPTLSQQISQLETTLGVRLVERGNRLLRLTPEGQFLLGQAQRVLDIFGDAIETLEGRRNARELKIGIPNYMSYPATTQLLQRFRKSHPASDFFLTELSAEELSQKLNEGELDAAFLTIPTPPRLSEDLESITVWKAPYLICLSRHHPLAAKPFLSGEDLAHLEIILAPRNYHRAHYDYQMGGLHALGFTPRIVHTQVSTAQSQMALATAGVGVCLISPDTLSMSPELVLKPTEPALPDHELALFWSPANQNPLLREFCNCARRFG